MLSSIHKGHLREVLLFVCGLFILTSSLAFSNGTIFRFGQHERKKISKGVVLRDINQDPVRITNIKVGNNSRKFGEDFDESDDWMKKLTLDIENHWNKPIVYLTVSLSFPETNSTGNEMMFVWYGGNNPGSRFGKKREDISIAPGDKYVINVADRYEWISKFVQTRHSMREINNVNIQVMMAEFEDGTAWGGGVFFKKDPNNPDRFIPINTGA